MAQQHVRLRRPRGQALRCAASGKRLVEPAEEQERPSPLQVILGELLRLRRDGVEEAESLARPPLLRVGRGEPETDQWVVGNLPVELLELRHGRSIARQQERSSEEIPRISNPREAIHHGAQETCRVAWPICLNVIMAQGENRLDGLSAKIDLLE